MTELERDARLSRAYRALGGEEPSSAVDAAILAAARRRGRRWQVPLAMAATLVLAVAVALVVEREAPREREAVALAPQVMPAPAPEPAAPEKRAAAPVADLAKQAPAAAARHDEAPRSPAASAPVAQRFGRAEAQSSGEDRAAAVSGALLESKAARKPESPERWLERIAELRAAGKHPEADESLAEFRRRHPDYVISEAMRARVLPR
jgi:hypothetical protein